MPILDDTTLETYRITGSNFTFKGKRIEELGATEYTLVTVAVDVTGSVNGFEDQLREMLIESVNACNRSARSDNLLFRVLTFSSVVGVNELHGFLPLAEFDPNNYEEFDPDGMTPLNDAVYSSVGAMVDYGKSLMDNDFLANGLAIIITDGVNNWSTATPGMIKDKIEEVRRNEALESLVTALVGINAECFSDELENFKREAGIDKYIDAGDATSEKIAKIAGFIQESISSQSASLGTGGPSRNISATI